MITLLSPAKKLLAIEKPYKYVTSSPIFMEETAVLIALMQAQSSQQLAKLMHLSETLANLNYRRYQNFSTTDAYPAIFLFQGDVYKALQAETWDENTLSFAQGHLLILSSLYGLLNPLDLIKPYRLEMGSVLVNPLGKNLYAYWKNSLTQVLNKHLANTQNPVLVNLASLEYAKAIDIKNLQYPLVNISFKEQEQNQYRTIGIHAKKARGAMAKFIMQHQINNPERLKQFQELNYQFCKKQSDNNHFVFIRTQA